MVTTNFPRMISLLNIMLHLLKTLLNTSPERHAFVVGLCETLAIFPPRQKMSYNYHLDFDPEYHYYMFGRFTGVAVLLLFAYIIKRCLWR